MRATSDNQAAYADSGANSDTLVSTGGVAAFLRIKKLKRSGIIAAAARHNKRIIQAESGASDSIDPTRSHLNYSLFGPPTADGVAQLAKDLMSAAGVVKLRKDAVLGIEAICSLPVNHTLDARAYFIDCVAWTGSYFGGAANVLSADVHLDEGAPHCHVLVLPLVDGRMVGGRLVGARSKLKSMHSQFHEAVAKPYGLRKASARMSGARKPAAAAMVLARLRETNDTAMRSQVWATIRDAIEQGPDPWLLTLGLELALPPKKLKPFVDYVTSKGKGPNRERDVPPPRSLDFTLNEENSMS